MTAKENLPKVILLASSFFCLFTAFATCQNIVSEALSLNDYGSLGFYTLAALYITFGVCSFLSAPLIEALGSIKSMQLGALCFFIWVCCGILPVTLPDSDGVKIFVSVVLLLAGIINGFGASILWVGQGTYISECGSHEEIGYYFGIFWCILMLSQIFGNTIAATILAIFPQSVFFIVMGVFALAGTLLFLLVTPPDGVDLNSSEAEFLPNPHPAALTMDNKFKSVPAALKLNLKQPLLNEDDIERDCKTPKVEKFNFLIFENKQVPSGSFTKTLEMMKEIKMVKVITLIILSGVILAFYSGFLVKLIANTVEEGSQKLNKALYCMVIFGVGEVCGAPLMSKIITSANNKTGVFYVMVAVVFSSLYTALVHSRQKYDFLWYFATLFWGMSDSMINTSINSICGTEFSTSTEPFAIMKFVQSITACTLLITESYIADDDFFHTQSFYIFGVGVYALVAGIITMSAKWNIKTAVSWD